MISNTASIALLCLLGLASTTEAAWTNIGSGNCKDSTGQLYKTAKFISTPANRISTANKCKNKCLDISSQNFAELDEVFVGISYNKGSWFQGDTCKCHYDASGEIPSSNLWQFTRDNRSGTGIPTQTTTNSQGSTCYAYEPTWDNCPFTAGTYNITSGITVAGGLAFYRCYEGSPCQYEECTGNADITNDGTSCSFTITECGGLTGQGLTLTYEPFSVDSNNFQAKLQFASPALS